MWPIKFLMNLGACARGKVIVCDIIVWHIIINFYAAKFLIIPRSIPVLVEFAWLLCELLKYRSRLPQWIKLHRRLQGYKTRWATFKKKHSSYKATASLNSTRPLNSFSRRLNRDYIIFLKDMYSPWSKIVARSWFESARSFSFTSDNASCGLSTS